MVSKKLLGFVVVAAAAVTVISTTFLAKTPELFI